MRTALVESVSNKVAMAKAPVTTEAPPQLDLSILVAEDNIVNQMVVGKLLERWGCRYQMVANGLEVLTALQRVPYDVVLMDVQMPEMDGLEATRLLRSQESEGEHQWIVALTANAMDGDRERFMAAGMDDYLSKPLRADTLLEKLLAYRGRHQ